MLGHPALVAGHRRGDPQREALLAEQGVAAVARAVGPDLARLGEVDDVLVVGVARPRHVLLALGERGAERVQAGDEVAVVAEHVERVAAHPGHDPHRGRDVGRVGELDADVRDRRAERAHRERHDVHRAALHRALEEVARAARASRPGRASCCSGRRRPRRPSRRRSGPRRGRRRRGRSARGRSSGAWRRRASRRSRRRPAPGTGGRTPRPSRRTSGSTRAGSAPRTPRPSRAASRGWSAARWSPTSVSLTGAAAPSIVGGIRHLTALPMSLSPPDPSRPTADAVGSRAAVRFYEYESRQIVERAGIPVTEYGFATTRRRGAARPRSGSAARS